MALALGGRTLHGLTFGHDSPRDALDHLRHELGDCDVVALCADDAAGRLAERLQAYAAGAVDDFLDVAIVPAESAFQRAVIRHCRRIPYAATLTYGELAARAGSPRAARAVGNIMARNRTPLVVPCHRVVGADGRMCGYSAGEGTRTKLRLLEQEALCAGAADA
jgi:methylated-DNA-[protein]-cysteine S-methyltransferase